MGKNAEMEPALNKERMWKWRSTNSRNESEKNEGGQVGTSFFVEKNEGGQVT